MFTRITQQCKHFYDRTGFCMIVCYILFFYAVKIWVSCKTTEFWLNDTNRSTNRITESRRYEFRKSYKFHYT